MSLDTLEQRLLEVLEATNAEQLAVLALLEEQHAAMTQRDLTRLSELATGLVSRAEALHQLEQERATITRQLTGANERLGDQPSLQEIAASSEGNSARLLSVRQQLLDTQEQVAKWRTRNQALASNVLEANDAALRNLMEALRDSGDRPDDRPRVLDRRA